MPMYGQLANVFGRRWPLIISGALFILGSGICGGYVAASPVPGQGSHCIPQSSESLLTRGATRAGPRT